MSTITKFAAVCAAAFGFAFGVFAEEATYEKTWTCDFSGEDESLPDCLSNATVANSIIGTTAKTSTSTDIYAYKTGTGTSVKLDNRFLYVGKQKGNAFLPAMFTFPSAAAKATEYQLVFDYMPEKAYGSSYTYDNNGVSLYTTEGAALFTTMGNSGNMTIYRGESTAEDDTLGTITDMGGSRSTDATTANYWYRFTIISATNGVTLTVTKLSNSSSIVSSASLAAAGTAVAKLMMVVGQHGDRIGFGCIDDITFKYNAVTEEEGEGKGEGEGEGGEEGEGGGEAASPLDGDSRDTVPVFLVGGQSNTDGRLDNKASDQLLPSYVAGGVEGAYVSAHSTYSADWTASFLEWAPCLGGSGQAGKWAYDTPLYYFLVQKFGRIYVAKSSYGGTSVNPSITNSGSGTGLPQYGGGYHWSANTDFLAATKMAGEEFTIDGDDTTYTGQSLLLGWIENMDGVIDAITAAGKTPDIKAIFWHQGESDNNNGSYAADLTEMVTYVREHLATKLANDKYKTLPFIFGSVPRKSSLFKVNLDKQFNTLNDTDGNYMYMADIYDQKMKSGDSKHFNATGAETLAKRMYNVLVDIEVADGDKLEVSDCVRKPDFGVEYVVNNTTTWTFENMSGDVARDPAITNYYGLYLHGYNTNSRRMYIGNAGSEYALNFTIGDTSSPVTTKKGVTCAWYSEYNYYNNVLEDTTAGASGNLHHLIAVNVGRAGKFEAMTASSGSARLYFNGELVQSVDAAEDGAERLIDFTYANTIDGTYYLWIKSGVFLGARFVPDEEQETVTLTIPESGVTTFGNLWNCSFTLPDGVKAYSANILDGADLLVKMTEVGAFNKNDAVIVMGEPGTYTLAVGIGAAYSDENLLVVQEETGVVTETTGEDFVNFLVTTDDAGAVILTKSKGDTTLEAGKAFFSVTNGDGHSGEDMLYFRNVSDSTKFYWSGKGADTLFTTLANWNWDDGERALAAPAAGSTLVFTNAATVTFAANTTGSGMAFVLDADVTFASDDGATERVIYPTGITGTGRLTLANKIRLQSLTYAKYTIENDIEVPEGATATIYAYGRNAGMYLKGALTGAGTLTLSTSSGTSLIAIYGDYSAFAGKLAIANGNLVNIYLASLKHGQIILNAPKGLSFTYEDQVTVYVNGEAVDTEEYKLELNKAGTRYYCLGGGLFIIVR